MTSPRTLSLVALAALAAVFGLYLRGETRPRDAGVAGTAEAAPFALVELFTSEGCSSCPPADANLARVGDRPGVVALAFHVDYWDRLGWPDPFARAAFTARQKAYAAALGARSLYTPQMVVNGATELVGSSRGEADAAIAAALKRPATVKVALEPRRLAPGRWQVRYRVEGAPAHTALCVAIAERGLRVKVRRGENAGRTLPHEHVVRAWTSVELGPGDAGGEVTLTAPEGMDPAKSAVVGFAQETRTMAVLGVDREALGPTE